MTVRHRPTCSVNRSTSSRWPTPEFVHLPPRELLLEQPQIVLLTSENLKHSAYSIVILGHAAWEQLAGEFGSALLRLEAFHRS